MGRAHLCHERQRIPDESLATACALSRAAATRRGRCQMTVDGELQRPLELLRPERKKKREHGIAKQPGLDEVRPGNAKIGECGLERGTVPEGDRHGFLRRETVVHRDIRRHRRLGLDADPLRDARADRGIDRPAVRSLAGRRACAAGQNGEERRKQPRPAGPGSTTARRHHTYSQHANRMISVCR